MECPLKRVKSNTKMLLYPFEKQLDLPPVSIEIGDSDRRQREVVGQEHPPFAGLGVFELDAAQWPIEVLARVETGERDGSIANQASASIDRMGITPMGFEVGFGARHKDAVCFVQAMEPFEIEIASVHDVEGTRFWQQQVQSIDVVKLAVADVQKRGDVAAQIQERVQLDGCFGRAKRCPRKHRHAQIDGAGIERVDRLLLIDAKGFRSIKGAGYSNERLCKLGIDVPVAHFVGISQRAARYPGLDPHVVQLARLGSQTRFDVAQALAIGQLGKGHAKILIEAGKALDLVLAAIARHATAKRRQRQMLRDLREHQFAQVHRSPLRVSSSQDRKLPQRSSNRDQKKS